MKSLKMKLIVVMMTLKQYIHTSLGDWTSSGPTSWTHLMKFCHKTFGLKKYYLNYYLLYCEFGPHSISQFNNNFIGFRRQNNPAARGK